MNPLSTARTLVANAQRITVLTGAGISAESGIPTFRDTPAGLWSRFRPEELATPEAFARDPRTVWEWYAWRRQSVASAQPKAGHDALPALERKAGEFVLVTQNVDGLHARAGSRNLVELHGNIARNKCASEGRLLDEDEMAPGSPPTCRHCGGHVRPDVVWFGEMLDPANLDRAFEAARSCDVFLSVGTSGLVEPAASLPFEALGSGASVIEVNPRPTPLSRRASVALAGPAGEILPRLVP
jgi:NAD-dependent deacetylase